MTDGTLDDPNLWLEDIHGADQRAWAYWMTNDAARQSLKPITYQQLVNYTGLNLISGPVKDD